MTFYTDDHYLYLQTLLLLTSRALLSYFYQPRLLKAPHLSHILYLKKKKKTELIPQTSFLSAFYCFYTILVVLFSFKAKVTLIYVVQISYLKSLVTVLFFFLFLIFSDIL